MVSAIFRVRPESPKITQLHQNVLFCSDQQRLDPLVPVSLFAKSKLSNRLASRLPILPFTLAHRAPKFSTTGNGEQGKNSRGSKRAKKSAGSGNSSLGYSIKPRGPELASPVDIKLPPNPTITSPARCQRGRRKRDFAAPATVPLR